MCGCVRVCDCALLMLEDMNLFLDPIETYADITYDASIAASNVASAATSAAASTYASAATNAAASTVASAAASAATSAAAIATSQSTAYFIRSVNNQVPASIDVSVWSRGGSWGGRSRVSLLSARLSRCLICAYLHATYRTPT